MYQALVDVVKDRKLAAEEGHHAAVFKTYTSKFETQENLCYFYAYTI